MSSAEGAGSEGGGPGIGLRAAAALLAASALLSRILGVARDYVLAGQLGAGAATDAYFAAFMLPDILNYLLAGGALSIALMPIYNRVRRREGDARGDRFFATVLGTLGTLAVLATVALWVGAEGLVDAIFPDLPPETRAQATSLTRIVLPAQVFFVAGGVMRAVLMAHGSFSAQALAPLFYNTFIIGGGLLTGTPAGFAWGATLGAFVGTFLLPAIQLVQAGRLRIRVAPLDPDFRVYIVFALPLMLGVALTTVDEFFGRYFAQSLPEGSISALSYGRKLMLAPVAIVGQAVAAAALPTFSRLWTRGDVAALDAIVVRTLRESLAIAIVAGAALFAFAPVLVELLYHHGRFGADEAREVTGILRVLAFAVPAWVVQQVAARAYFAREDTLRPMVLATVVALASLPVYAVFARELGTRGIAAAGVLAVGANAAVTLGFAWRWHGVPGPAALLPSALRAIAVAATAAGAALYVQRATGGGFGAGVDLALGGAAFGAVLAFGVAFVGDPAMRDPLRSMVGALGRRLRRS